MTLVGRLTWLQTMFGYRSILVILVTLRVSEQPSVILYIYILLYIYTYKFSKFFFHNRPYLEFQAKIKGGVGGGGPKFLI